MTLDDSTKRTIAYILAGGAIALLILGAFVPSAREYLAAASKMLLTAVGMSTQ